MATILFAWELGAGLGHINLMRPLAEGLRQRGHDVRLALRDLSRASELFDPTVFLFYQAPCKLGPVPDVVRVPRTFAQSSTTSASRRPASCSAWPGLGGASSSTSGRISW